MSVHISTVTTKGQTTVPGPVRVALGLEVGRMLVWELTPGGDGKHLLAVHPSPEMDDLAGCLRSDLPFAGVEEEKRTARKAQARVIASREKRSQRR